MTNTTKVTYTESIVSINNGNYKVPATVCIPNGPFAAVVMLHGTGSNRDEAGGGYKIAAHELAKAGIAGICIDFVGNGNSTEDYINYNYTTQYLTQMLQQTILKVSKLLLQPVLV